MPGERHLAYAHQAREAAPLHPTSARLWTEGLDGVTRELEFAAVAEMQIENLFLGPGNQSAGNRLDRYFSPSRNEFLVIGRPTLLRQVYNNDSKAGESSSCPGR